VLGDFFAAWRRVQKGAPPCLLNQLCRADLSQT
jgi:hypothetical protein